MEKLHHINLTYFTHFVLSFSFLNYAWSLNGRNVTISISDRSSGALFLLSVLGSRREKPDCLSIPGHFILTSSSKCPANNTQAHFFFFFFLTGPEPRGLQHTCEYRVCVVIAARSLTKKTPAETPQTLELETRHLKGSNRRQHLHIWYNNVFLWGCWPFLVALGLLGHRLWHSEHFCRIISALTSICLRTLL